MSEEDLTPLMVCVKAFGDHQYAACMGQSLHLLGSPLAEFWRHELMQMLLISAQRLKVPEMIALAADEMVPLMRSFRWEHRLLEVTTGRGDGNEALAAAQDIEEKCQALFYLGARKETLGDLTGAYRAFVECVGTSANCLEATIATIYVERLLNSPKDESTFLADPAAEVRQIYERAATLRDSDHDEALELAADACQLARSSLSANHPELAMSLNNLASLHSEADNYTAAVPLLREAVAIFRSHGHRAEALLGMVLINLAEALIPSGDFDSAEPLYREAFDIDRRLHPKGDAKFAYRLDRLASLHIIFREDDVAAKPLYEEALELRRHLGNGDDRETVGKLASLCKRCGDSSRSIALYEEYVQSSTSDPDEELFTALAALADLHENQGNYRGALSTYERALRVGQQLFGTGSRRVADILNSLAVLHIDFGDYANARSELEAAIEIWTVSAKTVEDRQNLLTLVSNLASLLGKMGEYDDAHTLMQKVIEIRRRIPDTDDPQLASTLASLGALYARGGRYDEAEPMLRRALDVERRTGRSDLRMAVGLANLSTVCLTAGRISEAETLLNEAIAILKERVGENDLFYKSVLSNQARLRFAQGNIDAGLQSFWQAVAIEERLIRHVLATGSERQRAALLQSREGLLGACLSLLLWPSVDMQKILPDVFNFVLRRKGIEAEVLSVQRDVVLGGRYPELAPALKELAALRTRIADIALAGTGPEEGAMSDERARALAQQREELEAALVRQIPEMIELVNVRVDCENVVRKLPSDTALIEFVRFHVRDFQALPNGPLWKADRYVAFTVLPTEPHVFFSDLGEADTIDRLIATFRFTVTGDMETRMYRGGKRAESFARSGAALREAVFDTIVPTLAGRRKIIVAPDGDLSRLPFDVLPIDGGKYLIDEFHISYVGSGRDMLRFDMPQSGLATAPIVICDPDFDNVHTASSPAVTAAPDKSETLATAVHQRGYRFDALPGTRVEGESVASQLGVLPWIGSVASEARLRAECRSPSILHIATHGFFMEDSQHPPGSPDAGFVAIPVLDPMLRSGLALAGANTWNQRRGAQSAAEKGLLTAEDVTGLDMFHTELVVLSACETGLGDIRISEGVLGLRRAFALAGARTLVMSLWKVPDLATAILMQRFYENLLDAGVERTEALREAQLYTRNATVQQIRERWLSAVMIEHLTAGDTGRTVPLQELAAMPDDFRPFQHPLHWGAFVCSGDPGPIHMA